MTDYSALIAELRGRYKDTKQMLPCELEHRAADAIEALISRIQGQAEPVAVRDERLAQSIEADAKAFEETLELKPSRVVSPAHPWGWRYQSDVTQNLFREFCKRHDYTSPPAAHAPSDDPELRPSLDNEIPIESVDFSKPLLTNFFGEETAPSDAVKELVEALRFYAEAHHFIKSDDSAWDTVSGEPQNFWCDEEGTATVEDGSVARAALAKHGAQAACVSQIAKSDTQAITAYGEKVRAAFIKELNRLDYWFSADVLRSMPLPAQSEGEEK